MRPMVGPTLIKLGHANQSRPQISHLVPGLETVLDAEAVAHLRVRREQICHQHLAANVNRQLDLTVDRTHGLAAISLRQLPLHRRQRNSKTLAFIRIALR